MDTTYEKLQNSLGEVMGDNNSGGEERGLELAASAPQQQGDTVWVEFPNDGPASYSVEPGQIVVVDWLNPANASMSVEGSDLIISGTSGETVIIENFTELAEAELPPSLSLGDGVVIPAGDLLNQLDNDGIGDIAPAAGPAGDATGGGGASFDPFAAGDIGEGIDFQDLLGQTGLSFSVPENQAELSGNLGGDGIVASALPEAPNEDETPPAQDGTPPAEGGTPPAEDETPPVEDETPPVEEETFPENSAPVANEGSNNPETEGLDILTNDVNGQFQIPESLLTYLATDAENDDITVDSVSVEENSGYTVKTSSDTVVFGSGVNNDDWTGEFNYTLTDGKDLSDPATAFITAKDTEKDTSDDPLAGNNQYKTLENDGNYDVLIGSDGADIIQGDDSAEVIHGGQDNRGDMLHGGGGNDTLFGEINDVLYGESGDDILIGGDGTQYLIGGIGNDTLTGGSGADTFVFTSENDGYDTILDFDGNEDTIDLNRLFDALGAKPALADVTFTDDGTDTVVSVFVDGGSVLEINLEGFTGGMDAGMFNMDSEITVDAS